nr:hypothetical protein [Tanacetum cinerariifolium]
MLPQQLDFFDVELEEGLEEVQGQLELDGVHSMEERVENVLKEDKRPDSSWHRLVLDSGPKDKDDTVVISI